MADSNNHYERAFGAYMRGMKVLTIPIEETRRTFMEGASIKSLDFIVRPKDKATLLIDVKGRKLRPRQTTLETWATEQDIAGLTRWESEFGQQSIGLLVFAFNLQLESDKDNFVDHMTHCDRHYAYMGITLADFKASMRLRSAKWGTYFLRQSDFRAAAKPVSYFLCDES